MILCYQSFFFAVFIFEAHQSTEVQITGTRNVTSRHVELVQSVDDLYSNMAIPGNQGIKSAASKSQSMDNQGEFIDLSQHAAEQLFSKDDLIILHPKCPLILPLLPNTLLEICPRGNNKVVYYHISCL